MGCWQTKLRRKSTKRITTNPINDEQANVQESSAYSISVPISKTPSLIHSRNQGRWLKASDKIQKDERTELSRGSICQNNKRKIERIFEDNSKFEGEIINEMKIVGKFTFANGDVYEGDFENQDIDGYGKFTFKSGNCYEGLWKNGVLEDCQRVVYADGNIYEGGFLNNKKHGEGKFKWANGNVYKGNFKNGYLDGQGVFQSGSTCTQGRWLQGILIKTIRITKQQIQTDSSAESATE